MKRNILIIGNSYSVDCHRYVSEIAATMGVQLDVHLLQKGGGKVKEIYEHRDLPFFDYRINDVGQTGAKAKEPVYGGTGCYTLTEVLDAVSFDTVILQNYWGSSEGIFYYKDSEYETDCSPYYEDLAEWIKGYQPNAKIMINAVWSNEIGCNYTDKIKAAARDAGFIGDGGETDFFYDMLERYNSQAAIDIGKRVNKSGEPVKQIPVGYAVQLARSFPSSDGTRKFRTHFLNLAGVTDGAVLPLHELDKVANKLRLNRDGFHLSFAGRYLAALVWVQTLTGLDVRNCGYVPNPETLRCGVQRVTKTIDIIHINFEELSESDAALLRELAYVACRNYAAHPVRGLDGSAVPFAFE